MFKNEKKLALTFLRHRIFWIFFLDRPYRDLFENGHNIFIRPKPDFIWIFEIFHVLKTNTTVPVFFYYIYRCRI